MDMEIHMERFKWHGDLIQMPAIPFHINARIFQKQARENMPESIVPRGTSLLNLLLGDVLRLR